MTRTGTTTIHDSRGCERFAEHHAEPVVAADGGLRLQPLDRLGGGEASTRVQGHHNLILQTMCGELPSCARESETGSLG